MISLSDILAAQQRILGATYETPCAYSRTLSERVLAPLYLKLENLQMTGSFKERGACNRLLQLSAAERSAGVITASAGNHAQGVAYHARELGCAATVVMPLTTALVKVSATRELGAQVKLFGANFDEAQSEARRLADERALVYVPAFDDDDVIAGQGTLGLELLAQVPELEAVVVPVGGGGLLAGVAVAIKESRPEVLVYGVEAQAVASMQGALQAGAPLAVEAHHSIADGIAVRRVGERCLPLVQRYVDGVIGVDEDAIAEAVLTLLEREKTVAEGAGATALAGVLSGRLPIRGKHTAVVVSGGNIDMNLISRVIDRGLWQSGRLTRLRCTIDDVPGALSKLLDVVGRKQANVLEVAHERLAAGLELGQTLVEVLLETRGVEHIGDVQSALQEAGIVSEQTLRPTGDGKRSSPSRSQRVPS
jgi:threonine dehydratase